MKNIYKAFLSAVACLTAGAFLSSCDVEPEVYSAVTPEVFFQSKEAVWARFLRPYTHYRWWMCYRDSPRFQLVENGADDIICFNWDDYLPNMHHHQFDPDAGIYGDGFMQLNRGIATAYDCLKDLEQNIDWEELGFTKEDKASLIAQMYCIVANQFMQGLDMYGGMPLYTVESAELLPRATAKETFDFIVKMLEDNMKQIPNKPSADTENTTAVYKAWAAMMLAELYINAKVYTDGAVEPMYEECAKICQDLIDGKYGPYKLADSFQELFGIGNEHCSEIIFAMPANDDEFQLDAGITRFFLPTDGNSYLGGTDYSVKNRAGIQPSHKPDGTSYDFKLGRVMEKFTEGDVRVQPFHFEGDTYYGQFLMGYMKNPSSHADESWVATGSKAYKNKVLYMTDAMAEFHNAGGVDHWDENGVPYDASGNAIPMSNFSSLPSNTDTWEESCLVRLIKVTPPVDNTLYKGNYEFPEMCPISRLTLAYYLLAECKFAQGDKAGAANLINTVRKRYFVNGNDPDPVTAANLDKYRLADEFLIEFLGEHRRRSDLIRWGMFTTEKWWDHEPDGADKSYLQRFPIGQEILSTNPLYKENPGY